MWHCLPKAYVSHTIPILAALWVLSTIIAQKCNTCASMCCDYWFTVQLAIEFDYSGACPPPPPTLPPINPSVTSTAMTTGWGNYNAHTHTTVTGWFNSLHCSNILQCINPLALALHTHLLPLHLHTLQVTGHLLLKFPMSGQKLT